jgi:uncharacterized protein (TIGR03067 family)
MRFLMIAFLVAVPAHAGDPPEKALEPFQGKWQIVEASERGKPADVEKLKKFPVTFAADQMDLVFEGQKTVKWTVVVRPDKDPKEIDATLPKGSDGDVSLRGIYQFDGDKLHIAFALKKGADRPARIEAVAGDKPTFVMVLKKAK